jgi:hypothetical protein
MTDKTVGALVTLQQEGEDLRRFKEAIVPIARRIPDIPDLRERQRRLKEAAAEIKSEWKKYKKSPPRFAADAILDATEAKLPAAALTVLGTAASTFLPFGVVAGLAVGITSYAGLQMWQKFQKNIDSPYQYLNRVHRAGATLLVPTCTPGR